MKVKISKYPKNSSKPREISIKIDKWDTYNLDHTLALIILPCLRQLRKTTHGSPYVDLDDLPDLLKYTEHTEYEHQLTFPFYNVKPEEELVHLRWRWVLGEMIWTFKQLADEDNESPFYDHSKVDKTKGLKDQVGAIEVDLEGLNKHNDRIQNGLRLFGKYFRNLWD